MDLREVEILNFFDELILAPARVNYAEFHSLDDAEVVIKLRSYEIKCYSLNL